MSTTESPEYRRLIAGVAHELNNPLTGILGYSELLLRQPEVSGPAARHAELIAREARRARRIVGNLLRLTRPRNPERRSVDVNRTLENVFELRSHVLRANGIELVPALQPGLPSPLGEADRLQQVFLNIIINAEQALKKSRQGGRIEVRSEVGEGGDTVRVSFHNDGPRIPSARIGRVFEPFFTTKSDEEGTGLGLAISEEIVREHGGRITVGSGEETGTEFVIELPVGPEEPEERSRDTSEEPARKTRRGRRILVVDDEPVVVEVARQALESVGHTVGVAFDAVSARDRISGGSFDAVVCDKKMPGGGGAEVLEHCRRVDGDLARRFLLMTGDLVSPDPDGEAAIATIWKPFRIGELAAAVDGLFVDR